MKAFIFCGGFGTRIKDFKPNIPKPLIKIKNVEILKRIIDIYRENKINDFFLLCGHSQEKFIKFKNKYKDININIIESGYNSLTQKRMAFIKKYLDRKDEYFLLTYGDSLAEFKFNKCLKNLKKNKSLINLLIYKKKNNYGTVELKSKRVIKFIEKKDEYINSGFYICKKNILNKVGRKNSSFEKNLLINLTNKKLVSFTYSSFWQPMDNKYDYDQMRKFLQK